MSAILATRAALGNGTGMRKTKGIMPFLHLHCMKDALRPDAEAASIADAAGIPIETLVSMRPFEAPISLSALDGVSGLIIGGSAWSVFEPIPYYDAFRDLLREARRRRLPMLGICFGAQALADVFGGKVVRDPSRAEYGSIEIWREAVDDPLLTEAPPCFHAQAWHHDRIVDLPERAVPLAWSQADVLQAFTFPDESVWGVQFHPERTHATFERLLETRQAPCAEHPIDRIRASLVPTPNASAILARFIRSSVR